MVNVLAIFCEKLDFDLHVTELRDLTLKRV